MAWGGGVFSLPMSLVKWPFWTFLRASSCCLEALHGLQKVLALQNTSLCFQTVNHLQKKVFSQVSPGCIVELLPKPVPEPLL